MCRRDIQRVANVVDFTREKIIDVPDLADLMKVNPVTVRRWFKRGLDWAKVGGKVVTSLEALNRFSSPGETSSIIQAVVVDRETLAALKSLKQQGFTFGTETSRDGRKSKVQG
jgi:hypothetical protein